jgi:hypothetical protein
MVSPVPIRREVDHFEQVAYELADLAHGRELPALPCTFTHGVEVAADYLDRSAMATERRGRRSKPPRLGEWRA